ncbi:DUF998 domain-containing protein [Actinophytocola oryzae]|uniref:Uncharacterized protein DUF998 n=1 Tax=Actinophytocola oryzae TaxID=502181 RepID=A0A4R7VQF8_9PSEU|nr:DUF998 domain-containing protein [Actinophytocola oryzae]TDV51983.1 uncharacterized protein DUF998 [Actinophytocola oryzae]
MHSRTALAGVVALVAGCVLMLVLHVIPPTNEISPLRRTLSQYALTSNKWLFDVAVLLVALGSVLVFVAVVRAREVPLYSGAVLLGVLWVASLLAIVTFTKTNWTVGPSIGGIVHRYASAVGFVSLPLAVLLLAGKALPDRPLWRTASRGFAVVSLAWFGVIVVGVVRMAAGYGPWWLFAPLGLVERAIALTAVAAITTLALGLAHKPRDEARTGDLVSAA